MDPIQLTASFAAILLLALFAGKLFPVKDILTLTSSTRAYQRFHPEATTTTPIIAINHRAAIIPFSAPDKSGNYYTAAGLVTKLGDKLVCRTLQKGAILDLKTEEDCITIFCDDFTQPNIKIRLAGKDMNRALAILQSLVSMEEKNAA